MTSPDPRPTIDPRSTPDPRPAANLLVELLVEELPPKALKKLGQAFGDVLLAQLRAQGLAGDASRLTPYATPRRLAAQVTGIAARGADRPVTHKLMPVSVGLDAAGRPTPALVKKLAALGLEPSVVPSLERAPDGKAESLFHRSVQPGTTLADGLQKALNEAIARLPIPKVMSYQLESGCELPGWSSVSFVRPAHGLVALHGDAVVPVQALGLSAGRETRGHRFEAALDPIVLPDADSYAARLAGDGAVIASFEARRAEIVRQLDAAAAAAGGGVQPIRDDDLLDEVTALVERPTVLTCRFEAEFLDVPQECLILTMKANQKYFPLLSPDGRLTHRFLVVSNIRPQDPGAVIGGNERVVRPRLADARFFFDQDRKRTLASRLPQLASVVYHNRLGSQADRIARVEAIAAGIAAGLGAAAPAAEVEQAATLAKTDLVTDMVGEFPELQGIMGRYYALADGLPAAVADAIEDHYKPRFAGDALPRGPVGLAVALADKLETLAGIWGIGSRPTGDRDPFALRRHALGVVRMLYEARLPLDLGTLVDAAFAAFAGIAAAGKPAAKPFEADTAGLLGFIVERMKGYLREQGFEPGDIDAALAVDDRHLDRLQARLIAIAGFRRLPEHEALAAANKRIANLLRKSAEDPGAAAGDVDPARFVEPAEHALFDAMQAAEPVVAGHLAAGDDGAALTALAALRAPVDGYFDTVMVNAPEPALKANRLAMLRRLWRLMNQVADLSLL